MKKRISVSDIAKAMGTSITTVSFILNGKARERKISEALTRRVLDYVKRMGYKPSQFVRNAPGGQVKVLALLVDHIDNPFFREVGKNIEQMAAVLGYQLMYFNTGNDVQRISHLLKFCSDKEVDGVVLTPSDEMQELIPRLKRPSLPVVLLDRFIPDADIPYVISDNRRGAYTATKQLLEAGGKRVGLVSLYANQTHLRSRLDGYMDAMDEFQYQSFIKKLPVNETAEETGRLVIEFVTENKLDAVLFADPDVAVSALKKVQKDTLFFPPVAVFGDRMTFAFQRSAVSLVTQDARQVAEALLRILTARIAGKADEDSQVVLPCQLVVPEAAILSREQISSKWS